MDEVETDAAERKLVLALLYGYQEAARIQYEEAENLMDVALAARDNASAMLDRCADLVALHLAAVEEVWPPVPPRDTYEDVDW